MASRSTVGAILDQAAISGPLSCEQAGGSPAMICARSLFIISVVKPGTGLCSQTPPSASKRLPRVLIARPSLPALHCEITVTFGFADCARAMPEAASVAVVPASSDRRLTLDMKSSLLFGQA